MRRTNDFISVLHLRLLSSFNSLDTHLVDVGCAICWASKVQGYIRTPCTWAYSLARAQAPLIGSTVKEQARLAGCSLHSSGMWSGDCPWSPQFCQGAAMILVLEPLRSSGSCELVLELELSLIWVSGYTCRL